VNVSLTSLNLSGYGNSVKIGDVGASAIAEALRVNASLTVLWLTNNSISEEGKAALRAAWRHSQSDLLL